MEDTLLEQVASPGNNGSNWKWVNRFLTVASVLSPLVQFAFIDLNFQWWFWLVINTYVGLCLLNTFHDRHRMWTLSNFECVQAALMRKPSLCNANRFVQVAFLFVTFIGFLALTIGMIMQEVLCIFTMYGADKNSNLVLSWKSSMWWEPSMWASILETVFFPVFINVLALILHGFTCIASEAFTSPPFTRCRGRFVIASAYVMFSSGDFDEFIDNRKVDDTNKRRLQAIDGMWFTICFPSHALLTGMAFAIRSRLVRHEECLATVVRFYEGFVFGITVWLALTALLRMISDFILHIGENQDKSRRDRIEQVRKQFQFFLELHRFQPGELGKDETEDGEQIGWNKLFEDFFKDPAHCKHLKALLDQARVDHNATICEFMLIRWQKHWPRCCQKHLSSWLLVDTRQTSDLQASVPLDQQGIVQRLPLHVADKLKQSLTIAAGLLAVGLLPWWGYLALPIGVHKDKDEFVFLSIGFVLSFTLALHMVSVATTMWMPFLRGKCDHARYMRTLSAEFRMSDWYPTNPWSFYHRYLMIFTILTSILFGLVPVKFAQDSSLTGGTDESMPALMEFNASTDWVNNASGSDSKYPVCSMSWAGGRFDISDLAALSMYSYAKEQADYKDLLIKSFGNGVADVLKIDDYENAEQRSAPRVVATIFKDRQPLTKRAGGAKDTIVVAVKGTDTMFDLYLDLAMYAGMAVYQTAGFITPVMDILPNGFIAQYFALYQLPLFRHLQVQIINHVRSFVEDSRKTHPTANFVMTGHSLGGGIAEVVGSRLGIETVVFSSPGAHFTRKIERAGLERQYRSVVNIVPDSDMVPRVDRHDGTVQRIGCYTADSSRDHYSYQRSPALCHRIQNTACELWRVCGDRQNRSFTGCRDFVSTASEGQIFAAEGDSEI